MKTRGKLILAGVLIFLVIAAFMALRYAPHSWLASILSGAGVLGLVAAFFKVGKDEKGNATLSPGAQSAIDRMESDAIKHGTDVGIAAGLDAARNVRTVQPGGNDSNPASGQPKSGADGGS